jgi:uncharacterized protein YndB with AHSA1/START domain
VVNVSVSGIVRAAPDDVFRFLADLENWPRWQSDMKSTRLAEGQRGEPGAVYRYVSKAMGMTFDSTVHLTKVDAPREVAFEGDWTGMIRPNGRYLVEPTPEGSRVTLNPATRSPGHWPDHGAVDHVHGQAAQRRASRGAASGTREGLSRRAFAPRCNAIA